MFSILFLINTNKYLRAKDEIYLPEWVKLLEDKETQRWWPRIVTFDPMGMTATNPTIAATTATLNIPELKDLKRDGVIVDADGGINVEKAAVYNVWNIPHLGERLELEEDEFRKTLHKYSGNPTVLDPTRRAFLPNIGGCTVYVFGKLTKIRYSICRLSALHRNDIYIEMRRRRLRYESTMNATDRTCLALTSALVDLISFLHSKHALNAHSEAVSECLPIFVKRAVLWVRLQNIACTMRASINKAAIARKRILIKRSKLRESKMHDFRQ